MDADAEALILFGTAEPPAPRRVLRAGAISAVLDRGQLRYLRHGDVELLRAISFTVRDADWGTDAAAIGEVRIDESAEGCRVSYRAVCARATGSFRYHTTIELDAGGRIRFVVEGAADAKFTTNRTGFVVLHPIDGVAGQPVEVLHTDGRLESDRKSVV